MHFLDYYIFFRLVGFAGKVFVDLVENRHWLVGDYFTEDRMLVVEVRSFFKGDEELAAISFRSGVGHAYNSWLAVCKLGVKLIFEGFSEDALSSWSCGCGVSSLQAKVFD